MRQQASAEVRPCKARTLSGSVCWRRAHSTLCRGCADQVGRCRSWSRRIEWGSWILDQSDAEALGDAVIAPDEANTEAKVVSVLHGSSQDAGRRLLVRSSLCGRRNHLTDQVERVL